MSQINNPKITVVTVTYNCANVLQATIDSVVSQDYANVEYIIVDGASTDGTLDIIKANSDRITRWVSEPDTGIYDAMNKGIAMATGEWINFMNAGDTFASSTVIVDMFSQVRPDMDIVYGDTNIQLSLGEFIKNGGIVTAKEPMPFCHQSVFVRSMLIQTYGFDLDYKICADRNLFKQLFVAGVTYGYIPVVVSNYESENGMSSKNSVRLMYEHGLINGTTKTVSWRISYCFYIVKQKVKALLPKSLVLRVVCRNLKRQSAANNNAQKH